MDENIQKVINNNALNNQYSVSPIPVHTHNGTDSPLVSAVNLRAGTPVLLGLGGIVSLSNNVASGSTGEQIQTSIAAGKDINGTVGNTSKNLILNLLHQPQNASNQSFITAYRPPLYSNIPGTTISTTSGGNTVTTVGYGFTTNALAGALINIYDSSANLIETQTIASNTATVITITGTWVASTSGGTLLILVPVFFGSAEAPWQRLYTQEGTGAGVRFGVGPTNGVSGTPPSQNGLLYMDATGDLYWRNKAGTATKVYLSASTPLAGTKVYYVSDSSGGAVNRKLTFTNGILTSET